MQFDVQIKSNNGKAVWIDTSNEAFKAYGNKIASGTRIKAKVERDNVEKSRVETEGTIFGICKKGYLWCHMDIDPGASYWTNIKSWHDFAKSKVIILTVMPTNPEMLKNIATNYIIENEEELIMQIEDKEDRPDECSTGFFSNSY